MGFEWHLPTGLSVGALRAMLLFIPLGLTAGWWIQSLPTGRRAGAVWIAGLWLLVVLQVANEVAIGLGLWRFEADGGLFRGVPVDVLLGWCLAWGPWLFLIARHVPIALLAVVVLVLDIALMPRLAPLVVLGDNWLVGELGIVALAFVPAHLLARWTEGDRHLRLRAGLQMIGFALINLWILPSAARDGSRSVGHVAGVMSISRSIGIPAQLVNAELAVVLCVVVGGVLMSLGGALGLWAVREFVVIGQGTPIPWDPPRHLVTTGPYARIANPMQMSGVSMLAGLSLLLRLPLLALATLVVFAYSVGLASWNEKDEMRARFGEEWVAYRSQVRNWIPRLRDHEDSLRIPRHSSGPRRTTPR